MEIGKILLNFNQKKFLIALAIFEDNVCTKYFVLKDLLENTFESKRKYLMVPEILINDTGLLGISKKIYEYFALTKYGESEIVYEELFDFDLVELKRLMEENKRLQAIN